MIGGSLFEVYLGGHTGRNTNRLYWRLRKEHNADVDDLVTPMKTDQNKELMKKYLDLYYGFLLYSMTSNTTKATQLSFNMTFSMNYLGLSRSGMKMLGDFGFGSKLSSFDKYKKQLVIKEANKIR